MIKTAGNTNRKLELLQRLITGNNWEVLDERYLACFLMPCVCHELYCLPLSALPPQQLESGAEQGPQKAPSAFAAANRYWVRLALAAAAFLFPWPVSQTRSGLPRVQPIEASILTLALEHRLERVANDGLTETEELHAAREEEARTSTPTLNIHLSIKPSALAHWCKRLIIFPHLDQWTQGPQRETKAWSKGRKIKMQVVYF